MLEVIVELDSGKLVAFLVGTKALLETSNDLEAYLLFFLN